MSARPRAAIVIEMERTQRAVNAFAALMAVAKECAQRYDVEGDNCPGCGAHGTHEDHEEDCVFVKLDAAHPGWREWTP